MGINLSLLDRELDAIEAEAGGRVGVAVALSGADLVWSRRGRESFPLERFSKFAIALSVLATFDRQEIHPDRLVELRRDDLAPGWSPIAAEFTGESERFTVLGLLARAVTLNDNTAADALTHLLGGPAAVTAQLRRWGVLDVRMDRLERERQTSVAGLVGWRPEWASAELFERSVRMLSERTRYAALTHYLEGAEDTVTPLAAVYLLDRWSRGLLLSSRGNRMLEKFLNDSPGDQNGLRASLPAGWELVHQNGTAPDLCGIGPATNDVGVMTSPKGHRLCVAVFIAGSAVPLLQRERSIGKVGRIGCAAVQE